ncbi:MAG: alanine racemase [Nanobdellota archaeon]
MFSSKIYLNKTNYQKNIDFIRKRIGTKPIFSSVVKGNAYGHGIKEFVPLAESCGINHFSVFSQDEAYLVKKHAKNNPTIMIMGVVSLEKIDWIVKNDIEFFIFNITRLRAAIKSAKRLGKKIAIHIELETGLNRTGFSKWELPELFDILRANQDHIIVRGLCTHFAGAESVANYHRIQKQLKRFKKKVAIFDEENINYELLHAANSAAAITMPKTRMDLVRIGVMQYGFWPSDETRMFYLVNRKRKIDPLKPILKWESEIMSIKNVPAGEYIGYGNYYLAKDNMKIGTVPVGFADGYSRALSNNSWVLVNGEYAEVIGVINMNLFQIDLTHFEEVSIGDDVVLIGENGEKEIRFASFSDRKSALNYEILTRIPEDIPREVIE